MLPRIHAEKKENTHSKHEKLVRPYEFFFLLSDSFFTNAYSVSCVCQSYDQTTTKNKTCGFISVLHGIWLWLRFAITLQKLQLNLNWRVHNAIFWPKRKEQQHTKRTGKKTTTAPTVNWIFFFFRWLVQCAMIIRWTHYRYNDAIGLFYLKISPSK